MKIWKFIFGGLLLVLMFLGFFWPVVDSWNNHNALPLFTLIAAVIVVLYLLFRKGDKK